jgi:hypothetical protein
VRVRKEMNDVYNFVVVDEFEKREGVQCDPFFELHGVKTSEMMMTLLDYRERGLKDCRGAVLQLIFFSLQCLCVGKSNARACRIRIE